VNTKTRRSFTNKITGRRLKSNSINYNEPPILSAAEGDKSGEIHLIWDPCCQASSYIVQKSTSVNKPYKWAYEDVISSNNYTVTNLKSSKNYLFRIAAVSLKGKSSWSLPVKKKAP